jgi:phosphopantetheinyl transferase
MIIVELPVEWRTRALVIAAPDDARMWLTSDEFVESEKMKIPRRREEWLDSRVAAKMLAVVQGHAKDPHGVRIQRPHLVLEDGATRFISISHSSPFVAAAIDHEPIGIDVEVMRDIDERAAHLFLRDDEIDVMQRCTLPYRMIHFWAAKEAAWKRRSDEFTTLKQLPLSVLGATPNGLQFDQVETFATEDLVVALTRS